MARETLTITLSPALRKALGLAGKADQPLDYCELLGVTREPVPAEQIDRNLKQRSRVLRQWQNSPEFGQEVIKLLPILHRAAKILMDAPRREAYLKQLLMEEKGETAGSTERFRELARVALVGNEITAQDRQQLQMFAREHGMDAERVRKIIDEVRGEYQANRQVQAPAQGEWEFRIAGEGADAFLMMLTGLKASGNHLGCSTRKLIENALGYGIDLPTAQEIVKQQQSGWFKDMVRLVAGNGAITEAQTRLLLPKAPDFGLSEQEAYAIIADYSLSAVASDDLRHQFELAEETFRAEDIEDYLQESVAARRPNSLLQRIRAELGRKNKNRTLPPGVMLLMLAVGAIFTVAVGYEAIRYLGNRGGQPGPPGGGPIPQATPIAGVTPLATPTPVATVTPAPTIPPVEPDPASGMLRLEAVKDGDPPPFEIRINEVTCEHYSQYLRSVLETSPPGWPGGGNYPPGKGNIPVTDITWGEAMGFCQWIAEQNGWPRVSVRTPTIREFERATRGVTIRAPGDPQAADYWDVARLFRFDQPGAIMANAWDRIILTGKGQMYDMIGNVAEWGDDRQADGRAVLGGGFNDKARSFNAMQTRWMPAETRSPWIGFRYVHVLTP